MADYEYVNNVINVGTQTHSNGHLVNKWENNVNVCLVKTNPAPRIDNGLVPRPPQICKSKGSRLDKLNKVIEDFDWDHLAVGNKEKARDVIINHEEVF